MSRQARLLLLHSCDCPNSDMRICCLQYRDLPHTTVLAVTVWEVAEGKPVRPLGGGTMRLFSKHGRLKTGTHRLHLWEGQEADPAWPSTTPGKQPVRERGEIGYIAYLHKTCHVFGTQKGRP